ncbi:MAG: cupin domain-containing protein [Planctomycetota bacterium]|nr:cupin domain-containing protein [Planctomycetota bacterium]
MLKEHLEFFAPDLATGWSTPPGYPPGIQEKLLAGALDEKGRYGCRTRLLRFAPGAFTTEPFQHEFWEEVFLVSGTLRVGGEDFKPFTYAVRPPHTPHGPFRSDDGCMLFEIHYFESAPRKESRA